MLEVIFIVCRFLDANALNQQSHTLTQCNDSRLVIRCGSAERDDVVVQCIDIQEVVLGRQLAQRHHTAIIELHRHVQNTLLKRQTIIPSSNVVKLKAARTKFQIFDGSYANFFTEMCCKTWLVVVTTRNFLDLLGVKSNENFNAPGISW